MAIGPDLMRTSMDMLILSTLSEESTYGYQLLKRIRQASVDMFKVHAGTMYAALYRLEGLGAVESQWSTTEGRPRKWYHITDKGQKKLAEETRQWHQYIQRSARHLQPILDQLQLGPIAPQPE